MRICALLAATICASLVAACGGSSGSSKTGRSTQYGSRSSPYAFSKCMRANGLSGFPDPSRGPGGGGVGFPGGVTFSIEGYLTVNGVTFKGPALKRAETACKDFLPPGGAPPSLSASQKAQGLRLARCMRAHGVPGFPDPGSGGPQSGAGKQVTLPGSNSPAFNHAVQVCGRGGRIQVHGGNIEGP